MAPKTSSQAHQSCCSTLALAEQGYSHFIVPQVTAYYLVRALAIGLSRVFQSFLCVVILVLLMLLLLTTALLLSFISHLQRH